MKLNFTHDVVVHKASIALASGESISRYTRALSEAGVKHVAQKLNMTSKSGSVYLVEAFSDSVIFDVYKTSSVEGESGRYSFFLAKYSRKDSNFVFGDLIEVERVESFKPKPGLSISKATSGLHEGWLRSTKNLWSGVL